MRINLALSGLAVCLCASSAWGQRITLSFPGLDTFNNPPATIGPLTGATIQTAPTGAAVTLTTPTTFAWFTTASCSAADRRQTITITTVANVPSPVSLCLIGLPTGGTFIILVSATAPGFPGASTTASVSSFPGGFITASTGSVIDLSSGQEVSVSFFNGYDPTDPAVALQPNNNPANPAWLIERPADSAHPCSAVINGGSCTVKLSANPNAAGLTAGSTYIAQVGFIGIPGGNVGLVAVSYTAPAPTKLQFVPITPCRIADTRDPNGLFGGPIMNEKSTRSFPVPSSACSIPSSAAAYSLNVTVVPSGVLGYLSIWPTGQAQPEVSTLNSDGRTKANAAIVPAGTGGGVSVYVSHTAHVILDINGYFVPPVASSLSFYPLTPCRVLDTRTAVGVLGGPYLKGEVARTFPVRSGPCHIPSTAQAYSLNFTAVPRAPLGFLSTWPAGQNQPWVSTLNASGGQTTANAAIVPTGPSGDIAVYASGDSDVFVDVNGYFAPPATGGLALYNLTPCRVVDTRDAGGNPFNGTINENVTASGCNALVTAQAFVLNATVVPAPSGLRFLTLWPNGQPKPFVSVLNSADAAVTSNLAITPTTNGLISAFGTDLTHLILDISGYFAP
jgi:hypothetical protein